MRATRGAASSAQATDRSLSGRPESSFPPLGPCSRRGIAIPGPKWPANRAAPFFRLALSATGGASPGNSPHRTRCAAVGGFAALRMRRAPRGVPRQITAGASPRPTVHGNFRASRAFTRRATTGRPYGRRAESSRPTSSTQVTDRSLRRKRQSSFPPLCLLSPPNPLRWASAGAPLLVSLQALPRLGRHASGLPCKP